MNLNHRTFELLDNENGLANNNTRMTFNNNSNPYEASYSGSNVTNGHVLVTESNGELTMLYHAFTSDDELVAGKALVTLFQENDHLRMKLNWQWLTGDLSSGISLWVETNT